jgi:hypothetical protein
MPNSKTPRSPRPCHQGPITLLLLLVTLVTFAHGTAVPVAIAPVPRQQFFDASGRPLAFGCLFSYSSGTTNALATYTDSTGTIQNANPLILTAGGYAAASGSSGLFLKAGQAYTIKVKSAGGTNCATGTTQFTLDGIGGGGALLTTAESCTGTCAVAITAQVQLFQITLTGDAVASPFSAIGISPPATVYFEIIQDNAGGHSWTWPANSVGGCTIGSSPNQVSTQEFVWDGSVARAMGPCVTGAGPALSTGSINVAGNIVATSSYTGSGLFSTCANPAAAGFLRLCKTEAVNWRNNANGADQGISQDANDIGIWSFAGGLETTGTVPDIFLGGTSASFPRLKRNSTAVKFRLGDDSADAPITASSGGFSGDLTALSLGCTTIVTKTAAYPLTADDCFVHASVSGGSFALTLPHAVIGKLWQITRTDTSANALTIDSDTGQVNNLASIKVPPSSTALCHSDGTNSWCVTSTATSGTQLIQTGRVSGCGGSCTFTYPIAYSATPNCLCQGEGGSCNVSSISTTQCSINTTVSDNQFIVAGVP